MKKTTVFGNYLLLERVNVGGMAEVFIAKSFGVEGFEKLVAIKKILPSMAEDEEFITMFIDEARISVQLSHANIVHIHELGKSDGSYFIAMEYVSGRDLRAVVERERKQKALMPVPQAVFIASKMCEGLDYAHRKKDARGQDLNIIHRDVSPQNILLSFDGEVKLIDFGIAKAANRSQKTQAGILKGKFGYMSPEQVMGKPIDRRSDVFAVGVILYEMLTGERLFVGESDFSTLEKVRNAEVPPAGDFNPDLPPGLEKVLAKALARDADERYQWCSDLQEDLMRFLISGDGIFSAKSLGAYMKGTFADELKREGERMERFATAERPEALALPPSSSSARGSGPRPKLQPSVPTQGAGTTPHRVESPLAPAQSRDTTALTAFDEEEPASPTVFEPLSEGDEEAGPAEKTQIVDHSEAIRKIQEYEARLQAKQGGSAFDEDEPPTTPPEPPSTGSPKVVIGSGAALSGETVIGMQSPLSDEDAEPAQETRMLQVAGDDEDTAGSDARPLRGTRGYDDDPEAANETRMLEPEDDPGEDPTPAGDDPYADEEQYADEQGDDGGYDDPDAEAAEEEERTTSERGRRAARRRARTAPQGPGLVARVRESFAGLEPRKRLIVAGGGAAVLLLLVIGLIAGLTAGNERLLVVAVIPADLAKIEINGHPVENNSQTAVEPGDYEIVATAPGYLPDKRRVRVSADVDPELVQIALEPEPVKPAVANGATEGAIQPASATLPPEPTTFSATFTTSKDGVEVFVDGEPVGTTPKVQLDGLEFGRTYRFTAKREGFKTYEGEFRSEGEVRLTVPFELEEEPPPPPPRRVSRPEPEPRPKPRPVAARVSGKKGKLACSSRPVGAEIWIDGRNTGHRTPLAISNAMSLPVGKHKLFFKLDGKTSAAVEIEIRENEVTKYVGDLQ